MASNLSFEAIGLRFPQEREDAGLELLRDQAARFGMEHKDLVTELRDGQPVVVGAATETVDSASSAAVDQRSDGLVGRVLAGGSVAVASLFFGLTGAARADGPCPGNAIPVYGNDGSVGCQPYISIPNNTPPPSSGNTPQPGTPSSPSNPGNKPPHSGGNPAPTTPTIPHVDHDGDGRYEAASDVQIPDFDDESAGSGADALAVAAAAGYDVADPMTAWIIQDTAQADWDRLGATKVPVPTTTTTIAVATGTTLAVTTEATEPAPSDTDGTTTTVAAGPPTTVKGSGHGGNHPKGTGKKPASTPSQDTQSGVPPEVVGLAAVAGVAVTGFVLIEAVVLPITRRRRHANQAL